MKITFDTSAFWETGMTYEETYNTVAEAGYHYISPYNADFPGFWKRPKATNQEVEWHKKAIQKAGLEIASLTTGFRIADPDEFMRQYAVDCWKRMIEIAEILGVKVFNTEFNGDRSCPELCEAKVMRSLDVLIPLLESKNMRMDVQAHPNDFYEHSDDAYDIVRYYDSPSLGYLYSIPHTFHYDGGKGDIAKMLTYCQRHLTHIIVADTWNYTKLFRYNINPAELYADGSVRCHAHIGKIGDGEVDFDAAFKTLRELGFGEREDTIATFNPLGFPERAVADGRYTKKVLEEQLLGHKDEVKPRAPLGQIIMPR
jgi:myo-inositol catabolism protein IolH